MDTRTGKVYTPDQMAAMQKEWDDKDTREAGTNANNNGPKESWFFVSCTVDPSPSQVKYGVKGWHDCLCGSGKKFRECCRVKTPYVRKSK